MINRALTPQGLSVILIAKIAVFQVLLKEGESAPP
jgi:hypothetical protein